MKKCTNCGKMIPDDAGFCPNCGGKQEAPKAEPNRGVIFCPKCGGKIRSEKNLQFCPNCGAKIGAKSPAARPAPASRPASGAKAVKKKEPAAVKAVPSGMNPSQKLLWSVSGGVWALIFCIAYTGSLLCNMIFQFSLVNIISYILMIFICIGVWMVYAGCRKNTLNTTGFSMINVIMTIMFVLFIIAGVIVAIFGFVMIYLGFAADHTAILYVLGIILLAVAFLIGFYGGVLRRTTHDAFYVAKGTQQKIHSSIFAVVMTVIGALGSILMLIWTLIIRFTANQLTNDLDGYLNSELGGLLAENGLSNSYSYSAASSGAGAFTDSINDVILGLLGAKGSVIALLFNIAVPVSAVVLLIMLMRDPNKVSVSAHSVPNRGVPGNSVPGRSTPNRSISAHSVPDRSTSNRGVQDYSAPDRGVSNRGVSDYSAPDRSTSNRSFSDYSAPDRSVPDYSASERSLSNRGASDYGTSAQNAFGYNETKNRTESSFADPFEPKDKTVYFGPENDYANPGEATGMFGQNAYQEKPRKVANIRLTDMKDPSRTVEVPLYTSFFVGRNPTKSEAVFDYEKTVSSKHCEIFHRDGKIFVKDQESLNGTWLDGAKVETEVEIHNGSVLKMGLLKLRIEIMKPGN